MTFSWEHVWTRRETGGRLGKAGRFLAAKCDLQWIVYRELKASGSVPPGGMILEVGCGTAPVPGMLSKDSPNVYGVDVSPTAAAISSRVCIAAVADGRSLPFPSGTFDLVFSTGVLDLYSMDQVGDFLGEMERVLRPGGRAVAVTSSKCALHRAVMGRLIRRGTWKYGPKREFVSLKDALTPGLDLVYERRRGAVFQLRFVSYLFDDSPFFRRAYHGFFLAASLMLRPLNMLPGALLVTVMEKAE